MQVPLANDDPAAPGRARVPRPRRDAALLGALLAFVILFGWWSLTRVRHFSHDSMIYVQVAQSWLRGRGLSADILYFPSFRYPARLDFPHPSTQFPPAYPLAIAAAARLGLPPRDAALALPVFALGGVLVLGPLLIRRLYDARAALIALALLLLLHPLFRVSAAAWSETPAIALWLLSLFVSLRGGGAEKSLGREAVAGLLAGLAFATRYAFLPALPVGLLAALAGHPARRRLAAAALYGAAWTLVAAPVVWRNLALTGYPLGPPRPPSAIPLLVNAGGALRAVVGHYAAARYEAPQLLVAGALAVGFAVWLAAKRRAGQALAREMFVSRQRFVLPLWTAAYGAFLVAAAAGVNLPLADTRLLAPASVSLALVAAAALAQVTRAGLRTLGAFALAIVLLKCLGLAHAIATTGPRNDRRAVRDSPRLQWVARQTTSDDLIVGDDAHDLGFHFDRKVVSFDYFNHSTRLHPITGRGLCVLLSWTGCAERRQVYLVLRDRVASDPRWRSEPLLGDLIGGRLDAYPQVSHVGRLADGWIYRWTCGPCAAPPAVRGK